VNAAQVDSWLLAVSNPQALKSLYSSPPNLSCLHSVSLDRDGPTIRLVLELDSFPIRPPKRWPANASCLLIQLDLFGLSEVLISGLEGSALRQARFEIARGVVSFELSSQGFLVRGKCLDAYIQRLRPLVRDVS
jgi:hypothetical protein